MDWQHGANNNYRPLFTVLLLLEVALVTGASSFFLVYSIPKTMYAFLFGVALGFQDIGFSGEALTFCAYIVTIVLAMLLFWVFAYRVTFYKPNVLNKIYYIGLAFWLLNLICVYVIDSIGAKVAGGADTLGAYSTGSILLIHLKHLAPFVFVYLHFTLLYVVRIKRNKE